VWGYGLQAAVCLWEWGSVDWPRLTARVGPPLMICLWARTTTTTLLHWPVPPCSGCHSQTHALLWAATAQSPEMLAAPNYCTRGRPATLPSSSLGISLSHPVLLPGVSKALDED